MLHMKRGDVGKVGAHLCLNVKELQINVEQGRVVTTLNTIKRSGPLHT